MEIGGEEARAVLKIAWESPRDSLATWIQKVARALEEVDLDLIEASEVIGCTVAELSAAQRLALLDDDTLALVAKENLPMTTWLLASEISADDLRQILSEGDGAYTGRGHRDFEAAVRRLHGTSPLSAVQNLDPALFQFAARKATAYAIWPPKHKNYGALVGFAKRRRSGKPLTAKQTTYAKDLLSQLVDAEVIKVPSPDGDDAQCEAILQVTR